jgi:guanylate kinase
MQAQELFGGQPAAKASSLHAARPVRATRRCTTLPPMPPVDHANRGLLLVISGPSGVGKTTITHEVERRLGGVFSVSVTTRPSSAADVEGRDYFFINEDEFARRRDAGELLEFATVFGKYSYGTPKAPVLEHLRNGRLVILEIDVQGALQIKRAMPEAYMIFVLPPSDEELLTRLRRRGRENDERIDGGSRKRSGRSPPRKAAARTMRSSSTTTFSARLTRRAASCRNAGWVWLEPENLHKRGGAGG